MSILPLYQLYAERCPSLGPQRGFLTVLTVVDLSVVDLPAVVSAQKGVEVQNGKGGPGFNTGGER